MMVSSNGHLKESRRVLWQLDLRSPTAGLEAIKLELSGWQRNWKISFLKNLS